MEKITNEMRESLRKPLPKEAVKQHPTKTYLSSIKAIYVTERLNDVFGIGSYKIKTEQVGSITNGMVVCKVSLEIPEYGVYLESFGGNDNGGQNSKNFDLGDAYKGATTDAVTKICSWLEIGIDVFKGTGNSGSSKTSSSKSEKELQWLNPKTKQWDASVQWVIKGHTIDELKQYYKISKTNLELFKNEINEKK